MAAVWLGGAAVFYRLQWGSGFRRLRGDDGDTRLAAYLSEHWFQVLHGDSSWLNPPIFYPVKGVLGWTDTFFLYQVFYAPFRFMGADPLLALQLTLVALSALAFVSFVYLVRQLFRTPLSVALVAGLIFVFSSSLWMHATWAQLSGVYLIPPVLLLAVHAWRAAATGRWLRAVLLGGLVGALWALLLFSTFYVAWFATVAVIAVGVLIGVMDVRGTIPWIRTRLRRGWPSVAATAAGFGLGIIPFARTYLPVPETYRYASAMFYSIRWWGVFNIGTSNAVWGSAVRASIPRKLQNAPELSFAVTPLVLLLAVGGGVFAAYRLITRSTDRPGVSRAAVAMACIVAYFTVAPIRFSFGSPWIVMWQIPGAGAIRAIDRVEIVTMLLAVLVIAAAAAEFVARPPRMRGSRVLTGGLVLVLGLAVVEQFNTSNSSHLSRTQQLALMRNVTAPPRSCREFYVVDSTAVLPYYDYQIDAMFVSEQVSMPTINGYSGRFPAHWGLLRGFVSTYSVAAQTWGIEHGFQRTLCRLDLGTHVWSGPSATAARGPHLVHAVRPLAYQPGRGPSTRYAQVSRA